MPLRTKILQKKLQMNKKSGALIYFSAPFLCKHSPYSQQLSTLPKPFFIGTDTVTTNTSMANSAKETISKEHGIPAEQIMICATHTHSSPYHADAILIRSQIREDLSIDVYAVSAGGISFVAFPYEMFDTNGKYIKDNTPFDMTFVLGYANSHLGYIASSEAYEYGCYEVDIRRYEKGTAEKLADQFVTMLKELKG